MFRIFTRPKGAPINDPRIGQPMWSKPGTIGDRVARIMAAYYAENPRRSFVPPNLAIRQQRRAYQRGKYYA